MDNGDYQYIKELSFGMISFYANRDNVPEHLQCIYKTNKTIKIKKENLDKELEQVIMLKLRDEIDFYMEHGDIEISSYRFKVEYTSTIEKVIYEKNYRKRN